MPLNIVNGEQLLVQGIALQEAGRFAEAEKCLIAALQANPSSVEAIHRLAILSLTAGQNAIALQRVTAAIQLNPNDATLYNTMGEIYRAMLDGERATAGYDRALELDPSMAPAFNNRGIVRALLGKTTEAISDWREVVRLTDNGRKQTNCCARAFSNLGNVYLDLGDAAKAIECHRHSIELDPTNLSTLSNFLRDHNLLPDLPPEQMHAIHREWCSRFTADVKPLPPVGPERSRDPRRRLRVGFVSPDFREHAVMYFLMGLFENYDRNAFEFICYSNTASPDGFTKWLESKCTALRNILGMPDSQAAQIVRQDAIDVLFDLAGHTAGNRFRMFAHKPAPVQVSYLGYPVTVGIGAIDYRLTDRFADPPGMTEKHYVETLWRLDRTPWCFQAQFQPDADHVPPVTRDNPFTFASFNNYAKVTPEMVRLWAAILQQVPTARLLLKANGLQDESVRQRIRAQFAQRGIEQDRLMLRARQTATADHLAQYRDADLALDTFPYHGTTTTCEAMFMNVPVVTLEGKAHMSRVGVSLLNAVGLSELIAKDPDEYIAIAVHLANDVPALTAHRKDLRQRLQKSPLMDGRDFAKQFCNAVRQMWQKWCAANP